MGTVNRHWFISNASRSYPVDDSATATDDAGVRLPDDIIVDLKIKFQDSFGDSVFISSVSVSAKLTTIMLSAAFRNDPNSPGVPIAAITVGKPVAAYMGVPLVALEPGVGGWIVLGSGANHLDSHSSRFSLAAQSRVCQKAATPYPVWPISEVGLTNVPLRLGGVVKLRTLDSNLVLSGEDVVLDGEPARAIVLRMATDLSKDNLRAFAGACGVRPESGSCKYAPIETINGISPDCDGKIYIHLNGSVTATPADNGNQAAISSSVSLTDVCKPTVSLLDELTKTEIDDCSAAVEEEVVEEEVVEEEAAEEVNDIEIPAPPEQAVVVVGSLDAGIFPAVILWPSIAMLSDRIISLRMLFETQLGECGLILRGEEYIDSWIGVAITLNIATQKIVLKTKNVLTSQIGYQGSIALEPDVYYTLKITTNPANPSAITDILVTEGDTPIFSLTGMSLNNFMLNDNGVYGVLVDGSNVTFTEPTLE